MPRYQPASAASPASSRIPHASIPLRGTVKAPTFSVSPFSRRMETPMTAEARGYTATKDQLLARLKRIEGQVRGVQGMVEDDRDCIDVLTQISAIQAALGKVALGLLDDHARHCVVGGAAGGTTEERTSEMMAAVGRLMRRG